VIVCKRCGDPITGRGKTGLCQPCAGYFQGKKVGLTKKGLAAASKNGRSAGFANYDSWSRRNVPVTLAGPK
jgi:hypothetical protein